DDAEDVLRSPRGEHVHQHQGERAPENRRDYEKWYERREDDERKKRPPRVHDAECREHRDGKENHHPARVDERFDELRAVKLQPLDGRRSEQVEVARQEKTRQRRDDVREQQNREEPDEDQPEQLPREEWSNLGDAAKVAQQTKKNREDRRPKGEAEDP